MRDSLGNFYNLGIATVNAGNTTQHIVVATPQGGYYNAGTPMSGYQQLHQIDGDELTALRSMVDTLTNRLSHVETMLMDTELKLQKLLKIKEVSTLKQAKEMR